MSNKEERKQNMKNLSFTTKIVIFLLGVAVLGGLLTT